MMKRHKITIAVLMIFAGVIIFNACKKEVPHNPYDDINYGDTIAPADTVDPFTLTGLHRNIFSKKCAQPGCHDGNFEPDFRTVQSTYLSLVYHPLVKTDSTNFFVYRVKPYDTTHSWLHERLVTTDPVLGRMPLYSNPLSADEMNQVNTWILNGAPNADGTTNIQANGEPVIPGYLCLNMNNIQVDTNRLNDVAYNPFVLAPNTQYQLVFVIEDDTTAMGDMQNVQVMFNTMINGFPSTAAYPCTYLEAGQVKFWRAVFNTSQFTPGAQTFFRFYFNDGDHTNDTEFPRTESGPEYKHFFSFIIQ